MKTTRLNTLAACLGLLFCVPELWAHEPAEAAESRVLDAVTVRGRKLTADQKAKRGNTAKTSPTPIWAKNTSNATALTPPATSSRGLTACTT